MDNLDFKLLNDFQRDFPLIPNPYENVAESLGTSTKELFQRLDTLKNSGAISRIGPVFRPNTVGASTLCAIAVAPEKIESIAITVNSFKQVNHNYRREHFYNLWFVVTSSNRDTLAQTLIEIEKKVKHSILELPLVKDYHIDLGFTMLAPVNSARPPSAEPLDESCSKECIEDAHSFDSTQPGDLIEAIQSGLPFVESPYKEIAISLGWSEQAVIDNIYRMLATGTIKRMGVVVRHLEMGYRANAMVVWDVPDHEVDDIGTKMGNQDCVRLCYQRPRRLPDWNYNLFCMVHGKNREEVLECIDTIERNLYLEHIPHKVLFSTKRYKQRGAHYRITH